MEFRGMQFWDAPNTWFVAPGLELWAEYYESSWKYRDVRFFHYVFGGSSEFDWGSTLATESDSAVPCRWYRYSSRKNGGPRLGFFRQPPGPGTSSSKSKSRSKAGAKKMARRPGNWRQWRWSLVGWGKMRIGILLDPTWLWLTDIAMVCRWP